LLNPPQSKRVPQTDVFCDPFSGWPGWPTSPTSVLPENRERLAQPLNVIFNSIFIACFSSPVFNRNYFYRAFQAPVSQKYRA